MTARKAALLTAATLMATSAAFGLGAGEARAADFPQVIEVPQIVEPPRVKVGGGWYLRGDVGVSVHNDAHFYNRTLANENPERHVQGGMFVDTQLDEGVSIAVGAGYRFNNYFRVDATAEFRGSIGFAVTDKYDFVYEGCVGGYDHTGTCIQGGPITEIRNNFYRGSLNSQVYLANAYADFGTFGKLTPFIGAGIGAARHSISGVHDIDPGSRDGGAYTLDKSSNWDLAYALHAGVGFKATDHLTLEVGYRYLNMGDAEGQDFVEVQPCPCTPARTFDGHDLKDLESHDVRVGMRWEFGGHDYVEPLPPVHIPDIPYKH
ncbi:MAG: outer membrane beta-barrel protein [Pseudomonadota bacterium]